MTKPPAWPVLLALLACSCPAAAGRTGPRIANKAFEVVATHDPLAVYSTAAVAINPADPRQIVAASNTLQTAAPVIAFVSRDRGATFTRADMPKILNGVTQASSYGPSVSFDRAGNAYCAYMLGRTAFDPHRPVVAILPAGKTTWEGPFPASLDVRDDDKPFLTVDAAPSSPHAGYVYVAWDRNNIDGSQNVYLSRSSGGKAWLAPTRVDDASASGRAIYATPATGPDGEVYVVWNDYAAAGAGFLKVDRSLDGGATFGTDRTVTDLRLNLQPDPADPYSVYSIPAQPDRGIAACPSIGVDVSGGPRRGWVYVCYADRAAGKAHDDTDVFLRRSTDRGATWSPPIRVNDDTTSASQFMPWMSVDPVDGSVNIAYYDARDDSNNERVHVTYTRSLDGGASFEPNLRVTSAPSDQSTGTGDPAGNDYGDYLGLAATGGQIACAWTDDRDGRLNQVWAATLVQGGTAPAALQQAVCSLNIPSGTMLAARAITLTAQLRGPSAALFPEWEVKAFGVPFDGSGTVRGSTVTYNGSPVIVSLPLAGLADGGYHWRLRAVRADGLGKSDDWCEFGFGPGSVDFTVGVRYGLPEAMRALRIAAGLSAEGAADAVRLGPASTLASDPCDTRITLADAVAIARAARL